MPTSDTGNAAQNNNANQSTNAIMIQNINANQNINDADNSKSNALPGPSSLESIFELQRSIREQLRTGGVDVFDGWLVDGSSGAGVGGGGYSGADQAVLSSMLPRVAAHRMV
jgi:hypothetical protein